MYRRLTHWLRLETVNKFFRKQFRNKGEARSVDLLFLLLLVSFSFFFFFLIYSMRGQPNWFWTHNKRWSLLFLQFLNFHPPLLDFKPETFKLNSQVSTAGMSPREDFERGPKNVWCWMFLLQFFWQYCFLGGQVYDFSFFPSSILLCVFILSFSKFSCFSFLENHWKLFG